MTSQAAACPRRRRRPPSPLPARGASPRAKSAGLAKGDAVPGVAKTDPIMVIDNVTRRFGGLTAVDVEHLEIPRHAITALIGPNGAGKTTLFNILCGFDKPNSGTWSYDGKSLSGIPAFKVARMGQVRTFQLTKALSLLTVLENMKLGATGQRGEGFWTSLIPAIWRKQDNDDRGQGHRAPGPLQARHEEGRLRGLALGRAAQAPRDGARAHERPAARDAGRADGRREPRAHAVAARPHLRAQGPRHDGAVRRARHAHGAPHRGLGHRHGRRPCRRRGPARHRHAGPGRHRRLPRQPPGRRPRRRHRPHRGRTRRRGARSCSKRSRKSTRRRSLRPRRTPSDRPTRQAQAHRRRTATRPRRIPLPPAT